MDREVSRNTFEAILAGITDAVCLCDPTGALTFANPAAARLGLDKCVARGPAALVAALDPQDAAGAPLPREAFPVARALRGETVSGFEMLLADGAGGRRRVLAAAQPLPREDGGLAGALVTWKDVTEEARARDEARAAREAGEEANRLKERFIAALSHELRAPLQPILAWTEVLRRHGSIDDVTARALEAIRRNVRQQVRLVDDLLDLSRIAQRALVLRYETFDLREQVRAAAAPFEEAATLKRVRLLTSLPPRPVLMWGDGSRVHQIAETLIANALEFTPAGGRIAVTLTADDEEARLEVRDTGDGIAAEDLGVIFDAFRQGAAGRRRGGLGLRLELVRRLVEQHGGVVEARSEGPGRGACFLIRLPLGLEHEPAPAPAPAEGRRLDRHSILIIEDNDDTREVLKYMLELEGARVETAVCGHDGVRTVERFHPQIVLCDIGLPDIDGLEVARLVREREEANAPRLIALTGYGQAEDVRHALDAGFEAHLTKPVNLDELLALLGTVPGVMPQK
jgi:signal transduction histidine kinase/ActR/RegA family two-component response regulator